MTRYTRQPPHQFSEVFEIPLLTLRNTAERGNQRETAENTAPTNGLVQAHAL